MRVRPFWVGVLVVGGLMVMGRGMAQSAQGRVVRIAELEIDPAQVEAYRALLKEEIRASVKGEAGVLRLDAVSVKGHPEQVRLFEVYASEAAYEAHLRSAHFLRYKAATAGMVKGLRLVETEPLMMGDK